MTAARRQLRRAMQPAPDIGRDDIPTLTRVVRHGRLGSTHTDTGARPMIEQEDVDRIRSAVTEQLDDARQSLRRAEADVRQGVAHLREQGPLFEPKTKVGRAAFYGAIVAAMVAVFVLGRVTA